MLVVFTVQQISFGQIGTSHYKRSSNETNNRFGVPTGTTQAQVTTNLEPLIVTSPFYFIPPPPAPPPPSSPVSTNSQVKPPAPSLASNPTAPAAPQTTPNPFSSTASNSQAVVLTLTNTPPPPPPIDLQSLKFRVKWQVEEMTDATKVVHLSIKNRHATNIYENLPVSFIIRGASPAEEQIVNGNLNIISNYETRIDIPIYKPKEAATSFFTIPTSDELPPGDKPLSTVKSVEVLVGTCARFLSYDARQVSETVPPANPGK